MKRLFILSIEKKRNSVSLFENYSTVSTSSEMSPIASNHFTTLSKIYISCLPRTTVKSRDANSILP